MSDFYGDFAKELDAAENAASNKNIQLPVEEITERLIRELTGKIRESKGKTVLHFTIVDREAQVSLNLFSKSYKVGLTQPLVDFLDDNQIRYSIA